jgi:hypothetical protein
LWHKIKSSVFYMWKQAPGSAAPVEVAKGVPHGRILRAHKCKLMQHMGLLG